MAWWCLVNHELRRQAEVVVELVDVVVDVEVLVVVDVEVVVEVVVDVLVDVEVVVLVDVDVLLVDVVVELVDVVVQVNPATPAVPNSYSISVAVLRDDQADRGDPRCQLGASIKGKSGRAWFDHKLSGAEEMATLLDVMHGVIRKHRAGSARRAGVENFNRNPPLQPRSYDIA